jgi:hypothetical protein
MQAVPIEQQIKELPMRTRSAFPQGHLAWTSQPFSRAKTQQLRRNQWFPLERPLGLQVRFCFT